MTPHDAANAGDWEQRFTEARAEAAVGAPKFFLSLGLAGSGYRALPMLLLPLLAQVADPKLLEIGLGRCEVEMNLRGRIKSFRGIPGASLQVWRALVPKVEMWVGEYDAACLERTRRAGRLFGAKGMTGDQSNHTDVERWARTSGGNFTVIIDDGGHSNKMILTSFDVLWPTIVPGGLYLIEDLRLTRTAGFEDTNGKKVFSDVLQYWLDVMLTGPEMYAHTGDVDAGANESLTSEEKSGREQTRHAVGSDDDSAWAMAAERGLMRARARRFPPPPADLDFIFCESG
eukprot:6171899-Pleurochrysis_carterae.AAC.5